MSISGDRRVFARAWAAFPLAVLGLWLVDLLVHLHVAGVRLRPEPAAMGWLDVAGLLQAEIPLALLCTLAAVGWTLLARLAPSPATPGRDLAAGLTAALCFFTVLTGAALHGNAAPVWALAVALPVAAVVLLVVRSRPRGAAGKDDLASMVLLVTVLPLLLGFGVELLGAWVRTPPLTGAAAPAIGLVAALLILVAGARTRRAAVRRAWAALTPLVGLALVALASAPPRLGDLAPRAVPARSGRPDVVLIVLDTVRADHLALYGHVRDTMPLLEAWAREATVFRRAVSPAGWTTPSHASMLSGRTPSGHGIHYGRSVFTTRPREGIEWLPDLLGRQGYRSIAVVANPLALHPGISGFDRIVTPRRDGWASSTMAALFEKHVLHNPVSDRLRWRLPYADARWIADLAMRAVPDDDAPVFLLVNFLDAHSPYNPPEEMLRGLGVGSAPSISRTDGHRELTRRWKSLPADAAGQLSGLYDGELAWIDRHLARLLKWVDRRFGKECLVIVTSDHGEELGEQGRVGHEWGLGQSLLHVPLLIRGPGWAPEAVEAPVSLAALFDLVRSLGAGDGAGAELLTGPRRSGIVSERYPSGENARLLGPAYDRPWVALLDGERKGVGPSDRGFALYDLVARGFSREVSLDPQAGRDLAGRIDAYWEAHADGRAEEREAPDARERERLRSLGYAN